MSMIGLLDDPGPAAAGARRGQRGHLERAAADDVGAGRAGQMRRNDVTLDQVMETTADAVDSGLLQFSSGSVIGTGGTIDDARTSGSASATRLADRHARRTWPRSRSPPPNRRRPRPPRRCRRRVSRGSPAADRRRGRSTASPGLLLVVEKLPWANTLEMTQGVEDAIASLQPGLPGVTFDTTIFRQADFIKTGHPQPHRRR